MTFINRFFLRSFLPLLVLAWSVAAPAATDHSTLELRVDGLVCAFCAQGIERRLKTESATADVFVSLEHGLVAVALKPGTDIGDEALDRMLREAGYTLRGVERTQNTLEAVRARVRSS